MRDKMWMVENYIEMKPPLSIQVDDFIGKINEIRYFSFWRRKNLLDNIYTNCFSWSRRVCVGRHKDKSCVHRCRSKKIRTINIKIGTILERLSNITERLNKKIYRLQVRILKHN